MISPNTPTSELRAAYERVGSWHGLVLELFRRLEAAERERERDHFKALAESRWDGAIEANQERDALAAHVLELEVENAAMDKERSRYRLEATKLAAHAERLKTACEASQRDDDPFAASDGAIALRELFDEAPETSLARHDLLKQAEAFATEALKRPPGSLQRERLQDVADELRRQAKENNHETNET